MSDHPKISIISTVYNTGPYLRPAVESILAQTFTDFELLLVDDGSHDGSAAVCDALAQEDARIRVFHQPNGGPAHARNTGLDNARGDYIGMVDSDDLIEPTMFATLYSAVQVDGVRLAACAGDCKGLFASRRASWVSVTILVGIRFRIRMRSGRICWLIARSWCMTNTFSCCNSS